MYNIKKYIVNNINQLCTSDKDKIIDILTMYQYDKYLKWSGDGVRIDMSLIKDEHINNIFNIINNIINSK